MILRCTIEAVPWGEEQEKHLLRRFDISNEMTVHRGAFGHDLCAYWVRVFREDKNYLYDGQYQRHPDRLEAEWPLMELHDRRDGPEELVRKVLDQFESGAHWEFYDG